MKNQNQNTGIILSSLVKLITLIISIFILSYLTYSIYKSEKSDYLERQNIIENNKKWIEENRKFIEKTENELESKDTINQVTTIPELQKREIILQIDRYNTTKKQIEDNVDFYIENNYSISLVESDNKGLLIIVLKKINNENER